MFDQLLNNDRLPTLPSLDLGRDFNFNTSPNQRTTSSEDNSNNSHENQSDLNRGDNSLNSASHERTLSQGTQHDLRDTAGDLISRISLEDPSINSRNRPEQPRLPRTVQTMDADVDDLPPPQLTIPEPLKGIEARIEELKRQLPAFREPIPSADTLIYLGRLGLDNAKVEEHLKSYFSKQPLLVEHKNLLALNSPYFNKYLGPFFQVKRWKSIRPLLGDCYLPRHIKYIVNMTPDTEGTDAIEAIQNLSCPPGVLQWKESFLRWSNSNTLVGGSDENDGNSMSEEYSRVRHVKSIERFMLALQDRDPIIDSAVKLYTTVMVTKSWNIQGHHPMTDWAVRWLCADPNTRFIEALPETTLKMAEVLKCASLCKDAFGILVGEAVLDSVVNTNRPGFVDHKTTVYERVKGDIEEDWQNRIQHARNSFTDRVQKKFDNLVGTKMKWIENLEDMKAMEESATSRGKGRQFQEFLDLFKRFIRSSIYRILCCDYKSMTESWENSQAGGDSLYPRNTGTRNWPHLRAQERIFTRWFWKMLNSAHFATTSNARQANHDLIMTCFASDGPSQSCADYHRTSLLERVTVEQLNQAAKKMLPSEHTFLGRVLDYTAPFTLDSPNVTTEINRVVSFAPVASIIPQTSQGSSSLPSHIQRYNSNQHGHYGESPLDTKNSLEGHDILPLQTPDPGLEVQTQFRNRSKQASEYPMCTWWPCQRYLLTGEMEKTCPHCRLAYCPFHVDSGEHSCVADKSLPQRLTASGQRIATSNNDSPQAIDAQNKDTQSPKRSKPEFSYDKTNEDAQSPKRQKPEPTTSGAESEDPWKTSIWGDGRTYLETPSQKADQKSRIWDDSVPIFRRLLNDVAVYLEHFSKPMLTGVDGGNLGGDMFDLHLVQTLTCLSEEETNFLPLWADGLDDGTGGCFGDYVPEAGDIGPVLGPGGRRYATRSEGSEYSFASGSVNTTVNTSTLGHDGYRDTLPRGQVIASDNSDTSSLGGWSYIQGEIDTKKGKQPAMFTPDESEVATTLGALEDASVIDLGIRAEQKEDLKEQIHFAPQPSTNNATPKKADVDQLDDIFMDSGSDNGDFDSDGMEDSDLDIIDADDLMDSEDDEQAPAAKTVASSKATSSAAGKTSNLEAPKAKTTSNPAWENQESMANVVYVYKGGNGEDDDLMTRL